MSILTEILKVTGRVVVVTGAANGADKLKRKFDEKFNGSNFWCQNKPKASDDDTPKTPCSPKP